MADLTRIPFPTCGRCLHWEKVEMKGPVTIGRGDVGVCYGAAPTPMPITDMRGELTGQRNLRPMTPEGERACAFFIDLDLPKLAANDLNG
jgi:hypothetical protein